MKYIVEIKETLSRVVEVEAESKDKALEDVKNSYYYLEIILGWGDFKGVDFEIEEA